MSWQPYANAEYYEIRSEYPASTFTTPVKVMAPLTTGQLACDAGTDGRELKITVRVKDTTGKVSDWSTPQIMKCASVPAVPAAPTIVTDSVSGVKLANLDIVEVAWTLPSINGGTPVTDFSLYVRWSGTGTYTTVWEKKEQPATLKYRF